MFAIAGVVDDGQRDMGTHWVQLRLFGNKMAFHLSNPTVQKMELPDRARALRG